MQAGLEAFDPKHYYRSIKQQKKADFDYCCAYCGGTPILLTIDHIVPRSQNGTNEPNNLLPACRGCNESKGSLSIRRWYTKSNHRYNVDRWLKILEVIRS